MVGNYFELWPVAAQDDAITRLTATDPALELEETTFFTFLLPQFSLN